MHTNWIKNQRQRIKATQEDLAARLEIEGFNFTPGAISHWENGRAVPPMDNPDFRSALARALRMTTAELLTAMGYEVNSSYSEPAQRAASIVEQLPEKEKDFALDMLETLLARSMQ